MFTVANQDVCMYDLEEELDELFRKVEIEDAGNAATSAENLTPFEIHVHWLWQPWRKVKGKHKVGL